MTKNKLLILSALIIISYNTSFAQKCNCSLAFKWAKQAFEANDAGFQYILDQKGSEAYQIHNNVFQKQVKNITNPDSCVLAIRQWAKFFRVGHFGFIVNQPGPLKDNSLLAQKNTANRVVQDSAFVRDYDSNTVYLRIPTFASRHKREIDSIIHQNFSNILNKRNLIIDIRDNGGGDDASFDEILPILYTNPIRVVTVTRLSTPNNNKIWEDQLSQKGISKAWKAAYTHYIDTLNANMGKFIRLRDRDVYVTTYDVKYQMPQNIGIIINGNNGSTAEQFLLAAKQSKKVKLFGTTTMGELDISNMYNITSQDKKYTLWYCTSKSLRIPDYIIDNKGIAPDFFIDRSIPKEKWLSYVAGILEEW
ncbi:MAG: S41 family peptidase [Sphingobacteriales bacterium]